MPSSPGFGNDLRGLAGKGEVRAGQALSCRAGIRGERQPRLEAAFNLLGLNPKRVR